jgi:hypothetical protein
MKRLAEGDRAAFLPVYQSLWPVLRAFVVRQLPLGDAEDVALLGLMGCATAGVWGAVGMLAGGITSAFPAFLQAERRLA